jgi:hypothetical protein
MLTKITAFASRQVQRTFEYLKMIALRMLGQVWIDPNQIIAGALHLIP